MNPLRSLLPSLLLLSLFIASPAAGQSPGSQSQSTTDELSERVASLNEAISVIEAGMRDASGAERAALEAKLSVMRVELENRRRALHRVVTGMEPRFMDVRGDEATVEWEDEARALLSPLFVEFREATELPRRVGRLRRREAFLASSLPQIEQAMVHSAEAMGAASTDGAKRALNLVRQDWLSKRNETKERLAITRVELARLDEEHSSMRATGDKLLDLMGQRRTRRLLLALMAFLATFLVSHMLHRVLVRVPLLRRLIGDGMGVRILGLVVYVVGSVGAVGVLLATLYTSGDWVLLTLAVVVLVSLGLGARSAAPRFLREVQLLLNAGPVRQGERLVWNGVPWRVQSLSLSTTLINPAFPAGEVVRLPLRTVDTLISRPTGEHEPWFPTSLGDIIDWDGLAATVTGQGPDFVEIERDLSRITIPTPEFIAAAPKNLSDGFRHRVVLKLDRKHEKQAAREIPERLLDLVSAALQAHPSGRHVVKVEASFEAISSWSFDIEVEADFKGEAATHWEELMELVQRSVLEACVAEGWTLARSEYV